MKEDNINQQDNELKNQQEVDENTDNNTDKEFKKPYAVPLKMNEYMRFIDWVALPDTEREPKTQKEMAKILCVDEDTLSNWKKRDDFWDEVRKKIKSSWRDKLPKVVQALYLGVLQKKSASEFQTFMQYVDDWSPKTQIDKNDISKIKKIEIEIIEKNNGNIKDKINENIQGNEQS